MKKYCILTVFWFCVSQSLAQFFSLQSEINSQYGFSYNAGLNISKDFYTGSDNFLGASMSLLETYLLVEKNQALSKQPYPVAGIAYEYYRMPRKKGREYATRTGLGIYTGLNFKSFRFESVRTNQLNTELGLSLASMLTLGYGRNLLKSYPAKFNDMPPGYFFLRLTLGRKRTLFSLITLGGGMV